MNGFTALTLTFLLTLPIGGLDAHLGASEPAAAPVVADAAEDDLDPFGIYGADADEQAEVEQALATFEANGLPLPELRIYVHDSKAGCADALGRFRLHGDVHRVDICLVEQPLILHELAHAWEHHFVNDATREAFMVATGAPSWEDPNHAHKARGIEKTAYLVAWALEDAPLQRISSGLHMDDLANYELLTGSPSPRVAHWADEQPVPTRDALADVELVAEATFA